MVFSINLFIYPCHCFYWCISPSKQGWVEIYILINIFDMTMLWLKLNGNREICIDHSMCEWSIQGVIALQWLGMAFHLDFFDNYYIYLIKGGFVLEREFLFKYFNLIRIYKPSMVLCGIDCIEYIISFLYQKYLLFLMSSQKKVCISCPDLWYMWEGFLLVQLQQHLTFSAIHTELKV